MVGVHLCFDAKNGGERRRYLQKKLHQLFELVKLLQKP